MKRIKEWVEIQLREAIASVMFLGVRSFTAIYDGSSFSKFDFDSKGEKKVREICQRGGVQAVVKLVDCYFIDESKAKGYGSDVEVKDMKGSEEAVVVLIFTKDATYMRTVNYKKGLDGWVRVTGETDWGVPKQCNFVNPLEGVQRKSRTAPYILPRKINWLNVMIPMEVAA